MFYLWSSLGGIRSSSFYVFFNPKSCPGSEATGIPPAARSPASVYTTKVLPRKKIFKFFTQNSKPVERNQVKKGIFDQFLSFQPHHPPAESTYGNFLTNFAH
jgi:hypothetical protein